jgi:hypothetical protein
MDRSGYKDGRDRRKAADRRSRPTNPFAIGAFSGRRRTVRRTQDRRRRPYQDQYDRRLLLMALLLLLLCVADGLFTLLHVSRGARELNPLMESLLQKGPFVFWIVKFVITAGGIVLLVIYRHHPLAGVVWGALVLIYGLLAAYHVYLFFKQPDFSSGCVDTSRPLAYIGRINGLTADTPTYILSSDRLQYDWR